jgi:hypothetical protein
METNKKHSLGFTLVMSLLLLLMLSGIAVGLFMMVNTESRAGAHDVENSLAYHSAEGAMEMMTSNLSNLYSQVQAPSAAQISGLSANRIIGDPFVTYTEWTLTPQTNPLTGLLAVQPRTISSGSNQGLYAQILPINLAVTAQRNAGDNVRMLRTVEVALIPVFQFGVFSDSDLGFFSSPQLDFVGRVHTNGDLYLGVAGGATLTFHDKLTAFGNVVRNQLPNGLNPSANFNNNGTVNIPTASSGCDVPITGCRGIAIAEASVTLGPTSAQNPAWPAISTSTYNGWIRDGNFGNPGGTGVRQLVLPFVTPGVQPFEIIRRPPRTIDPPTAADPSRLGNQAQIRVLLSDNPADLHLQGWNGNAAQDIPLCSVIGPGCPAVSPAVTINGNQYSFATANQPFDNADYVRPPGVAVGGQWPLIGGYLLVEYKNAAGNWVGVTQEWLNLGFARGLAVPTAPNANTGDATPAGAALNADMRNAILYFQLRADRNGDGQVTAAADVNTAVNGANSQFNWFPINLYDTREGEPRDWATGAAPGGASSCSVNGIMNVVELNVGNLKRWLNSTIPGSGNQVDSAVQNGYILYFSDRRGMLPDPVTGNLMGEYGFEDVINSASGDAATPDGVPEPLELVQGVNRSPEDLNGNGRLDTYGSFNVGLGFTGANTPNNPYVRVANCYTTGRKNRVTGARHALKLVDGSLGNVPTLPAPPAMPNPQGGFTVASENPVYILGDYNSSVADLTWGGGAEPVHAAAGLIADTVTLLSNNWQDAGVIGGNVGSLLHPTDANSPPGYRQATNTYYRVAIATGKTIAFPHPNFPTSTTYYGTDGGVHNFLRFLEDWSNDTLNYKGSMVSLFYSTYATGEFKCCNYVVYRPPTRNYKYDPLFNTYTQLPPGTPTFRDIDNLSYSQDFTPH